MQLNLKQLKRLGYDIHLHEDGDGELSGITIHAEQDHKRVDALIATMKSDYPQVEHDTMVTIVSRMFIDAFKQHLLTLPFEPIDNGLDEYNAD